MDERWFVVAAIAIFIFGIGGIFGIILTIPRIVQLTEENFIFCEGLVDKRPCLHRVEYLDIDTVCFFSSEESIFDNAICFRDYNKKLQGET